MDDVRKCNSSQDSAGSGVNVNFSHWFGNLVLCEDPSLHHFHNIIYEMEYNLPSLHLQFRWHVRFSLHTSRLKSVSLIRYVWAMFASSYGPA